MAKRIQLQRLLWMAGLLCLAFAGLGYRLVDLQVLHHEEYIARAQTNTVHEFRLEPRRGEVLDARGNILATTEKVKTVCVNPAFLGGHQAEVAHALAPFLQEDEAKLYQRLLPRTHRNDHGQVITNEVELKHKVKLETWDKIQLTMSNLANRVNGPKLPRRQKASDQILLGGAIYALNDQLRFYPNHKLAAHVLGYATTEQREQDGAYVNEMIGQDGVEETFDPQLAGTRGWRLTETDFHRREMVQWREENVEPRDGLNVVLTIDSVIQRILETGLAEGMDEHSPVSISGIVVRPRTGEILAMATLPNYDPNDPGAAPVEARRNRMIADRVEPGSTFKVVVVSGALNDGVVRLADTFDCLHGHFFYAGHTLGDHQPFDVLTVEQIIGKSSNIGAALIGIKMGEDRMHDYIQRFGFGVVTGLPLPGEVSAGRSIRAVKTWDRLSIARFPMGQGLSVTSLQMTMAICAMANQGLLMRPMLVDRLEDRSHNVVVKYSPARVRQVVSPATAKLMVAALKTVPTPEGTAPKAALEHYTVAGKTGTAQKFVNGSYSHTLFYSSFIGFFPADNPEVCISISMDEPKHGYYGGQASAPVFKRVAEQLANYLGILPEQLEDGSVAEAAGAKPTDSTAGGGQKPPHPALADAQGSRAADASGRNPLPR